MWDVLRARLPFRKRKRRTTVRNLVIIDKRGGKYTGTVHGRHGSGHRKAYAGRTPAEAAATATRYMTTYAQTNPEGGDLMAPPEVMDLVPPDVRSVPPQKKS